ncbi:immunity protein 72 of polymorphic toxin system [Pseudoduganella lurida]|uniref:Immunity protein 72 of polymorphic toxin system n=1 Tax=Pseudoduganella lurida TaxID=1036180 RepID=A0A562RLB4_9BURK|nr:Imm71 family immunity protein [Pseudoduganella lurida]TWI69236.1 immunity protein 72 of polymorphic toxin system [Pseudoduganella lurida]
MMFHWLQKLSSITAWRRILVLYRAWLAVADRSIRKADELGYSDGTGIHRSEVVAIRDGLQPLEKAVARLGAGDRTVLQFDRYSDLEIASRPLFHAVTRQNRIDEGENGIDEHHTPFWFEYRGALAAVSEAWFECSSRIIAPHRLQGTGAIPFSPDLEHYLDTVPLPSELPSVPDPAEPLFVYTGRVPPCSGIWEPVAVPPRKLTLRSLLLIAPPPPPPPFCVVGAMHYLHGGLVAPHAPVSTGEEIDCVDVAWRLLWRDERYRDGSVPATESSYRFAFPRLAPHGAAHPAMRDRTEEKIRLGYLP